MVPALLRTSAGDPLAGDPSAGDPLAGTSLSGTHCVPCSDECGTPGPTCGSSPPEPQPSLLLSAAPCPFTRSATLEPVSEPCPLPAPACRSCGHESSRSAVSRLPSEATLALKLGTVMAWLTKDSRRPTISTPSPSFSCVPIGSAYTPTPASLPITACPMLAGGGSHLADRGSSSLSALRCCCW